MRGSMLRLFQFGEMSFNRYAAELVLAVLVDVDEVSDAAHRPCGAVDERHVFQQMPMTIAEKMSPVPGMRVGISS